MPEQPWIYGGKVDARGSDGVHRWYRCTADGREVALAFRGSDGLPVLPAQASWFEQRAEICAAYVAMCSLCPYSSIGPGPASSADLRVKGPALPPVNLTPGTRPVPAEGSSDGPLVPVRPVGGYMCVLPDEGD